MHLWEMQWAISFMVAYNGLTRAFTFILIWIYKRNHCNTMPRIHISLSQSRRITWPMVSKAAERSSRSKRVALSCPFCDEGLPSGQPRRIQFWNQVWTRLDLDGQAHPGTPAVAPQPPSLPPLPRKECWRLVYSYCTPLGFVRSGYTTTSLRSGPHPITQRCIYCTSDPFSHLTPASFNKPGWIRI